MSLGSKSSDQQTRCHPQSQEVTDRILVVEDDPSVQEILKRLFEAEGFVVEGFHFFPRVKSLQVIDNILTDCSSISATIIDGCSVQSEHS